VEVRDQDVEDVVEHAHRPLDGEAAGAEERQVEELLELIR
jgi:hypothetical protein